MRRTRPRLCFAASSGGHLEELLMLRPLMERYDSFIVTEKTAYAAALNGVRCRYLLQVNRRQRSCLPRMALNAAHSLLICLAERPDAVVCTGALATVPLCLLAREWGIAPAEIAAVGDSDNDLAMLRAVGCPVAMGNASREVKEAADFVTASNDQEGAAKAILRLI